MWTCADDDLPGAPRGRGLPLRAVPVAAGVAGCGRQDGGPARAGGGSLCAGRPHPAGRGGDLARACRAADRSAATTTEAGEAGRARAPRGDPGARGPPRPAGRDDRLRAGRAAHPQAAFAWRFEHAEDPAGQRRRPPREFAGRGEPRIIPGPPERAAGFRLLAVGDPRRRLRPRAPARSVDRGVDARDAAAREFGPSAPDLEDEINRSWRTISARTTDDHRRDGLVRLRARRDHDDQRDLPPAPPPQASWLELRTSQGALRIDLRED